MDRYLSDHVILKRPITTNAKNATKKSELEEGAGKTHVRRQAEKKSSDLVLKQSYLDKTLRWTGWNIEQEFSTSDMAFLVVRLKADYNLNSWARTRG